MTNIVQRTGLQESILKAIRAGGEISGAQIAAAINIGSAQLYPALQGLENSYAIASKWAEGPPPRRRLYFIPPKDDQPKAVDLWSVHCALCSKRIGATNGNCGLPAIYCVECEPKVIEDADNILREIDALRAPIDF